MNGWKKETKVGKSINFTVHGCATDLHTTWIHRICWKQTKPMATPINMCKIVKYCSINMFVCLLRIYLFTSLFIYLFTCSAQRQIQGVAGKGGHSTLLRKLNYANSVHFGAISATQPPLFANLDTFTAIFTNLGSAPKHQFDIGEKKLPICCYLYYLNQKEIVKC